MGLHLRLSRYLLPILTVVVTVGGLILGWSIYSLTAQSQQRAQASRQLFTMLARMATVEHTLHDSYHRIAAAQQRAEQGPFPEQELYALHSQLVHTLAGIEPQLRELSVAAPLQQTHAGDGAELLAAFERCSHALTQAAASVTLPAPASREALLAAQEQMRAYLRLHQHVAQELASQGASSSGEALGDGGRIFSGALLLGAGALLLVGMTAMRSWRRSRQQDAPLHERTAPLQGSEARLAVAQRIAHLGSWEWDITTNQLYWSDEMFRLFGWAPQSFVPSFARHLEATAAEERQRLQDALAQALAERDFTYHIEHHIDTAGGERRCVLELGEVIRDVDGKALRMVGVVQDVTERLKVQEELELFRLMIEKSIDPIFLLDVDNGYRMTYVNQAAVEHFAVPREEILRWSVTDWDPNISAEQIPAMVEESHRHPGRGHLFETLHWVGKRRLVPVEVSINNTLYNGHHYHFGYIKNISVRKEMEQKLREAKETAEAAARIKSEFIANISHEIRTPMNAVINLSRLVLQTPLERRQRDYLQKVVRAGESLLGIINDILDFSKIESGRMRVEVRPFSLQQVIEDVSDLITLQLKGDAVEYLIDLPPQLPRNLQGDALRLRQVLTNLLGNALKFTEQGTVVLTVDIVAEYEEHNVYEFSVCDTGIGISRAQQQQLFQPFLQADGSTTRRYGGAGLGLIISNHLLGLMGSRLHVESRPGEGSSFSFTLTLPHAAGQREPEVMAPQLSTLRVLLVDDNAAARQIEAQMLHGFGCRSAVAASGEEALQALRQACADHDPFTLLLLDSNMPQLNGIETMARVMADAMIAPKPTGVLVASYGSGAPPSVALECGFSAVLDKPLSASKLLDLAVGSGGGKPHGTRGGFAESTQAAITRLRGSRVLLVEDNVINQEIASELLKQVGIEVAVVANGLEALAALEHVPFDLVLMDLQMPLLDGYETTQQIRLRRQWQTLPIVAMTAHALPEERARCIEAGMNDHLAKPIDIEQLYATLQHWIKPGAAAAAADAAAHPEAVALPPHLPGINIGEGVARIGNNRKLYRSLLLRFRDSQSHTAEGLLATLAAGELGEARRIAHTLKGVAGNLGANKLADEAATLVRVLVDDADERIDEAVRLLLAELEVVCASIDLLVAPAAASCAASPSTVGEPPRDAVAPLLQRIAQGLECDLGDALRGFELLDPLLESTRLAQQAGRLGQALADYDTDEALQQVHLIATALELELQPYE